VEIRVHEGQKAPIHTVVAMVDEGGAAAPAKAPAAPSSEESRPPVPRKESPAPAAPPAALQTPPRPALPGDGQEKMFASPLVRRIAREEGVDLAQLKGSGWKGRITKEDIVRHVEGRRGPDPAPAPPRPTDVPAGTAGAEARPAESPEARQHERVDLVPMSPMRSKIAEHMVHSRRTSAHVTTVFEADLSRIVAMREREKEDYERVHGTKLTITPFFAMAAVEAIREFPVVNSSVDGANIAYKRHVHLGIAVALPEGLIVPVVKHAEEKSFLGLCRAINDVADRARRKRLSVEEVQGGTFTITNPGIYGGLFGTPIIHQPQVAILGVGGVEKRPVVVDDAIAIRSMGYLVLSFDHRVIDGAVADQFMARVKSILQDWKIPIR